LKTSIPDDQKTVIAPKDRDDDAPLKTLSSNPKDKGNGKDQDADKGKSNQEIKEWGERMVGLVTMKQAALGRENE